MRANFLRGVRFADLTWAGAGPFGTKVFADFGAEILKVESMARPDAVRVTNPFKDGIPGTNRSGYFASRNTGKKSVAINMKMPEGRDLVVKLIEVSDVVSNNFGPGAMERLGLGYEVLRRRKPDIIFLSMPMYGDDGPYATFLGVGKTISAVTGLMRSTAYAEGDAVGPGTHYPDHAANPYHAAFAVLAALRYRRRTGHGMKIEVAQIESTSNFVGAALVEAAITGEEPPQIGNRSRSDAPHGMFRCQGDDAWCAIAVESDAEWLALAAAIGRQDLVNRLDLRHAAGRLRNVELLERVVSQWTAGHSVEEVARCLQTAGVPAAVVASSRYLIEQDKQLVERGYFQSLDHPEMGPSLFTSPPYRVDGERVELVRPPLFNEHTHEVMSKVLGLSDERIRDLAERKVLA
jgi:benzylsuccinate CoA-transferase BbsF subunit